MSPERTPKRHRLNPSAMDNFLTEIGVLKRNELSVGKIYDARTRHNANVEKNKPKKPKDLIALIKKEVGPESPIIRGPVEIGKGEELSLAINVNQEDAFAIVYGMDLDSDIPYYASVENTNDEAKTEKDVVIKYCGVIMKSTDHIIISQALAEKLEVAEGQDLKVLDIYQKTSDINLDELWTSRGF